MFSNHLHENDTSSQQLWNQSCVCLPSTLSAHISVAPERGRAGVSGAEWATEGLMLALTEPSLPAKTSSDTTRTIEARNCPLDFPLRQSWKKLVSHAGSGQEKGMGRGRRKRNKAELIEVERMRRVVGLIPESGWLAEREEALVLY